MSMRTLHSVEEIDVRWDEDNLIERLCQALDAAERAIRQLDEDDCNSDGDQPHPIVAARTQKLVTETAVFLLAASNVESYAKVGPRILRVASLLLPHARSQCILRAICMEPALAFEHATAHICLKRLGFYDADFDAMLDLCAAAQACDGRERAPHRMIEQEWLKQGWLYPEGLPRLRVNAQVTNSVLNRTLDLLHGTRQDVSSFTHALMYLRDFNLFPRSLPRPRQVILTEADAMLARALDEQNYDLVAEILLAWPLTGGEWSPAATFAFRVLSRVDRQTSQTGQTRQTSETAQPSCVASGSDEAVHSLYRRGILCAAMLAPDRQPPVFIPHVPVRSGAFDAVFDCFDHKAPKADWQNELEHLDDFERESLAEFFLAIALHRDLRCHNFEALERTYQVGLALGLANTPISSQVGEMIARVSQFSVQFSPAFTYPAIPVREREIAVCA